MQILVTGASGFLGHALVEYLANRSEYHVLAATRSALRFSAPPENISFTTVGDLSSQTDWRVALAQTDVVIHCAARVHVMNEVATDPLAEFKRVNVEGTLNLARQAAAAGVKRFIFISSIKVNGEQTLLGHPFFADAAACPCDPYGVSKLIAEQELLALARAESMEVVILRPVLIYGPGVKANFLNMMRWLDTGMPLPLGCIHGNRRSLVALDNLIDLIRTCIDHPAAAGQIFLAADGEDLSTTTLLQRTARAMGRRAMLLPVPPSLLMLAAKVLRKPDIVQRLCGSLQADLTKNRELLGWSPPISIDEALKKTAAAYRRDR